VRANPITIEVSPSSGSYGTAVTVSGDDATAGGEVRIYIGSFFFGIFAASTNANSLGGYTVSFAVPAFPLGPYDIVALDVETGDTETETFTIAPMIILDVEEGYNHDEVTMEGHGFNFGRSISLVFDGIDITPTPQPVTDDFGSFTATFIVPKVPEGTYLVGAYDGTDETWVSFSVLPRISLYPTSGPPSTPVVVNGTGFGESVTVTIEFGNVNVTMYPAVSTDSEGSFMQMFLVPDMPDGIYSVVATDELDNSATAPFTTPEPVLVLTPNTTSGHAVIVANGSGFPPHAPIMLYLEDILTVNFLDLMTERQALFADEYGSYEYSFIVPVLKPDDYTVSAYSVTGGEEGLVVGERLASASLTIVEDALLTEIYDNIATIIIPGLDAMQVDLEEIQASIVSIEGDLVTINSTIGFIETDLDTIKLKVLNVDGDIATLETILGTIQGTVDSIDGNTATIKTDVGTVKTDISDVTGSQGQLTNLLYITLAMALIAAAGGLLLLIMHMQALRRPVHA
jgi:hypothetical protein